MTAARAVPSTPALSASVEDYLKAIYHLEQTHGAAGNKELAQALDIAAPSVTGMVRRLAEQGFIRHEPYKGARLSEKGRRAALRTLRRHRIIELYLTTKLGYPWDRVHDEAERLEHSASDELIDRMADALGDPDTDPHGAPIPTREGRVEERARAALDTIAVGDRVRVAQVSDKDAERLRYLGELGIRPGVVVSIVKRAPSGGAITVAVGDAEHVIGESLAGAIRVDRV